MRHKRPIGPVIIPYTGSPVATCEETLDRRGEYNVLYQEFPVPPGWYIVEIDGHGDVWLGHPGQPGDRLRVRRGHKNLSLLTVYGRRN